MGFVDYNNVGYSINLVFCFKLFRMSSGLVDEVYGDYDYNLMLVEFYGKYLWWSLYFGELVVFSSVYED